MQYRQRLIYAYPEGFMRRQLEQDRAYRQKQKQSINLSKDKNVRGYPWIYYYCVWMFIRILLFNCASFVNEKTTRTDD